MKLVCAALLMINATAGVGYSQRAACPVRADESTNVAILSYIQKKFKLPGSVALTIAKDEQFRETCYRKITFQGKDPVRTWELILYLSPDRRFLSSELFDVQLDPAEEERSANQALMKGLTDGNIPTLGPADASVTIVEFSDFQCPFCRDCAKSLQGILESDKNGIRLVFHHLPLSGHGWAQAAAQGAECALLQSNQAFWSLHDQIFENQHDITEENVRRKLLDFTQSYVQVDMKTFVQCLDNQLSLGLIFRDMNLASSNQITATPTLFINGHRVAGVTDGAKLRELISEAKKEAALLIRK